MTVRKPMQSPTSPRAKVTTPWPTADDRFKPLPHTPSGSAVEKQSWSRETRAQEYTPSHTPTLEQQPRKSEVLEGSTSLPEYARRASPENDLQRDSGVIATPKSSSESQRVIDNAPVPLPNPSYEPPTQGQNANPNTNPFRRKGLAVDVEQSLAGMDDVSSSHGDVNDQRPRPSDQLNGQLTSQLPPNPRPFPQPPRLDLAETHSPIDLSGFSGDYFADLQQLQQSKINAEQSKLRNSYEPEGVNPALDKDPARGNFASTSYVKSIPSTFEPVQTQTGVPCQNGNQRAVEDQLDPSPALAALRLGSQTDQDRLALVEDQTRDPLSTSASGDASRKSGSSTGTSNTGKVEDALRQEQVQSPKPRKNNETYQIRLVNWHDATSRTNPRQSPVMVQNANGPCPLLALVNALVLSTPSELTTALVETLRVREQVSLGLLLDAVIDELMSGRRIDTTQELPDVSDLYAFLLTLHTGMNVNPRFCSMDSPPSSLIDADIQPMDSRRQLGGFENTREMRLYSTFAVPLIHGWMPPRTHPAFVSLKRSAKTYEDAQNILFREEELEGKLSREGLNPDEQMVLEDIGSIKYFLSSTATQLTGYGLDSIMECLAPGCIAILFRNDHFSTLYKHPRSSQLMTLVTDMGYAGHDEVVWESLVDVSGEGSEFFSGDFRQVGNLVESTEHTGVDEHGWQTVTRRPRKTTEGSQSGHGAASEGVRNTAGDSPSPSNQQVTPPKSTEQEDHDLALAMQLQEEEEERHRRDAAARRREDELSERYLSNSDPATGRRTFPGFGRGARGGAPQVPPRGGSNQPRSGRQAPAVTRRQSSGEEAPPSYEVASKVEAYHPPPNHPAHPSSSPGPGSAPRPAGSRHRQSGSAYSEQSGLPPSSPVGGGASGQGPFRPPASPASQAPSLPKRSKGRSSWGPNLENAPGVLRRSTAEMSSGGEEEPKKKEKECCVM